MCTRFVNPYNFIPISKEDPDRSPVKKGTYSGVIKYQLLTKTPLIIPNTSNDDAFNMGVKDHKSYDFFSYNDLSEMDGSVEDTFFEPVIPGSEMRGMIRSNYEILTNSCLSAVDDDDILSKRTLESFKAGLLKKTGEDTFELYAATDCLMRTSGENSLVDDWNDDRDHYARKCYIQSRLKEGQKVYFDFVRREGNQDGRFIKAKPLAQNVSDTMSGNKQEGYIIKGEAGPEMKGTKQQKHCCHVFKYKNKLVRAMTPVDMASLDAVLKAYKDNREHPYDEYSTEYNAFKGGKCGEMFPVYYSSVSTGNEYIMLSPACITREIYRTKIRDMLKAHNTCDCEDKLCPACTLFGTIGKGKETGKAFHVSSRLRFSDLYLDKVNKEKYDADNRSVYEDIVTLRPLSNPKLNNMEFYLKQPDKAWFWTYDYYIDENGDVHCETGELNGRKFYWHNMEPDMTNQERSDLNSTVRPVSEGVVFEGSLFFDRIEQTDLNRLIYTLESGDPNNDEEIIKKKHGYKLGHAKPLGYGSVAIKIESVTLTGYEMDTENRTIRFVEKDYDSYSTPRFDSSILKDFAMMTDFDAMNGKTVSYPIPSTAEADGSSPVFSWFVKNHLGYDRGDEDRQPRVINMPNKRKQMVFYEHLIPMEPEVEVTGTPIKKGKVSRLIRNGIFIRFNDTELFAHINAFPKGTILQDIKPGTEVAFLQGQYNGRPCATSVIRL